MEDYQLRKDIDRLRSFLDELEVLYNEKLGTSEGKTLSDVFAMFYDQSEVETRSAILKDDLRTLNTDLGILSDSLVDFNQTLITFNGDTETLADDLTTLKDNLSSVLTDFTQLKTDLDGFDSRLDTFDGQLDTFDGQLTTFDSRLTTFNGNLNQFNTTLTSFNSRVTDLETGLSSLEATVDLLDDTTDNLSSDTMALLNSLNVLVNTLDVFNTYLTDFEGDLNDLEDELSDNNIDTSSLNTNLLNLIVMIGEVKSDVSTVTGVVGDANNGLVKDLNDVQGTIGDTNTVGTVKYEIANTKSIIGNENTGLIKDINDVQDTIGDNTGGLIKDINDIQSDIGTPTTQNTIKYNIKQIDNTIGNTSTPNTLKYDVNQTKSNISSLETTIGDNNSGLIKNVNKTMSDIETVQSDISDVQSGIQTVQGNISTVQGDITTAQEHITDLEDTVGDNTTGLVKQTNDNTADISALGHSLGRFLQPKLTYPIIYCSPNAPSDTELTVFRGEYNIDSFLEINYWLRTSNNKAYYKNQNTGDWNSYNLSHSSSGVLEENWILLSATTPPLTYKYSALYNTVYFQCWFNPKTNGYYEPVQGNWGLADGDTFFTRSQMVVLLDNFFSLLGHTHTVSDITNMSSAFTDINAQITALQSGKANNEHTHSQLDILDAPKWTSLYSGNMGIVESDDNLVAVRIKTGSTAISSSDWTTMGELSRVGNGIPRKYYPKSNVFSPYLNGITIMINTDGEIKAIRPTGQINTSVEINIVYPVR